MHGSLRRTWADMLGVHDALSFTLKVSLCPGSKENGLCAAAMYPRQGNPLVHHKHDWLHSSHQMPRQGGEGWLPRHAKLVGNAGLHAIRERGDAAGNEAGAVPIDDSAWNMPL
jgi:hypothetical protein